MRVATVVPIDTTHMTEGDDYFLCLAHLMRDHKDYADFYSKRKFHNHWKLPLVIMDNGVVETGEAMAPKDLFDLATEYAIDEVILPDYIRDAEWSMKAGMQTLSYFYGRDRNPLPDLRFRTMAVPHGKSLEEWMYCAMNMLKWPVETIGISKFQPYEHGDESGDSGLVGRERLVDQLNRLMYQQGQVKAVHLLGYAEPLSTWDGYHIRGIDSGIATICAHEGLSMGQGRPKKVTGDPFTEFPAGDRRDLLIENIRIWREWVNEVDGSWSAMGRRRERESSRLDSRLR